MAMLQLQNELEKLTKSAQLSNALDDVDKIINLLTEARERIAAENDPHITSLTLTKLQNPVQKGLEAVNDDLRNIHRGQNRFGKALEKAFTGERIVKGSLPEDHDPMAAHPDLINRAIAMHLLREGQFGVASTFISEAKLQHSETSMFQLQSQLSPSTSRSPTSPRSPTPDDTPILDADDPSDLSALQSDALQSSFASMYSILSSLKTHDLLPAITWARKNCTELEARGSNLEFELCKLQFIWLFKGPSVNGLPDTPRNGRSGALQYARDTFGRFQHRHLREIQQLSSAMVYASNLPASPYRSIFDIEMAFEEVAASFTREFCSLLGLSAESPLYVAATAGAIALPQLMRFLNVVKGKGTEWTTEQEMAFEIPLPKSMIYHSIFVCPVSKEQSTEENPPMMMPCGHVLARESLQKISKGNKFKCPYCPSEGVMKDAREIIL
ncbi:CTLH/CRA C-terminal to lish motif domain-containing protein [Xylariales sp. AK1849]|nr:CTLH/CRA C-terminal to lish motif domain-containing protein [Xylariales sp. AK1849]